MYLVNWVAGSGRACGFADVASPGMNSNIVLYSQRLSRLVFEDHFLVPGGELCPVSNLF